MNEIGSNRIVVCGFEEDDQHLIRRIFAQNPNITPICHHRAPTTHDSRDRLIVDYDHVFPDGLTVLIKTVHQHQREARIGITLLYEETGARCFRRDVQRCLSPEKEAEAWRHGFVPLAKNILVKMVQERSGALANAFRKIVQSGWSTLNSAEKSLFEEFTISMPKNN